MACCATTVDDCLFVTSNDGTWIQKQIDFLKAKYEDVAVEMGDEIGLIGMQVKMDRIDKKVILTQPKNVQNHNCIWSGQRCSYSCTYQCDGR